MVVDQEVENLEVVTLEAMEEGLEAESLVWAS